MTALPEELAEELKAGAGKPWRLAADLRVVSIDHILHCFLFGNTGGLGQPKGIGVHVGAAAGRLTASTTTPQTPKDHTPPVQVFIGAKQHPQCHASLGEPPADAFLRDVCTGARDTKAFATVKMLVLIESAAILHETPAVRATLGLLARDTNSTVAILSDYEGFRPGGQAAPQLIPAYGTPDPNDLPVPDESGEWADAEWGSFKRGVTGGEPAGNVGRRR